MPIKLLDEQVVAQIAAGEVVERPASVVKELIENALDAGAGSIHVETQEGGQRLIRVSDDGSGIAADEVLLAFTRHATSKLSTTADLEHIRTLGFRGEALASIAAVSRVQVVTQHHEETIGTQLQIEGGRLLQQSAVGVPHGTVVTVENLFFNTPARLKFLKSENTEKRQITTIITHYAMAYPGVRFILQQDGRESFRSSGRGQLADAVVQVLGLDIFKQMIEVSGQEPTPDGHSITVEGFVSDPQLHRADRTRIVLYINGRVIQDARLAYAAIQSYHTLLAEGRFPYAVLLLEMPPEYVDVNVHPTKAEVRFQNPDAVFVAVQRAVRQALLGYGQRQELRGRGYGHLTTQPAHPGSSGPAPAQLRLSLAEAAASDKDDLEHIPEGAGQPDQPRTLPVLRVIGQIGATYIIAEGPAGMYLIDQHAAHSRILYEQLLRSFREQETAVQHLLEARPITLPPADAQLLEAQQETLAGLGFLLDAFGPGTFLIRAVPAILADQDPVEALHALIHEPGPTGRKGAPLPLEQLAQRISARAAVKSGQILNMDEMRGLVHLLERTPSPHTGPDGSPTMLHMSSDQLAREFGRSRR